MTTKIKADIAGFDQATQDEYNGFQARRSDLAARLAAVKDEIKQININLGAWVAEGCDYKEFTDTLAELEAEAGALKSGIDYLGDQLSILERNHSWLRTR